MAKEYSKSFYDSKRWQDCRKSFIKKRTLIDGGMCQSCGKRLGEDVDHIEEISPSNIYDSNITLNHVNLQYLCKPCHSIKTNSGVRRVTFDDDGNPILFD